MECHGLWNYTFSDQGVIDYKKRERTAEETVNFRTKIAIERSNPFTRFVNLCTVCRFEFFQNIFNLTQHNRFLDPT